MLCSDDRIAQHRRFGWALFYEHHVATGDDALGAEQTILRQLRAAGHGLFFTAAQLSNGWTETFDAGQVSATDLQDAIRNGHQAVQLATAVPVTSRRGRMCGRRSLALRIEREVKQWGGR